MKKLLALLLVVVLAFSVVACGTKDAGTTEKPGEKPAVEKEDDSKEAEKVAEEFFDAFVELDFDKAEKYVDDKAVVEEAAKELDFDAMMDTLPDEFSPYKSYFEEMFDAILDAVLKDFDYEIKGVEEDGDKYIVEVELTAPVTTDLEGYFEDAMSEDSMGALAMELYTNGTITEDMSEDEIYDAVFAAMVDYVKDQVKNVDVSTETETVKVTVYEKDGEWLIEADSLEL